MDFMLLGTAWVHVLLTPYTKVEESFNLHATHDVLIYGLRDPSVLSNFDHFVFPGAVPRSFLGSIILAYTSLPIIHVFKQLGVVTSKADLQIVVRLVLATLNALSLCLLRRAVSKRFGYPTAAFFAVLSCTQFHLPFWMGRTLPNMFALFPVNLAFTHLLSLQPNSTRPAPSNVRRAIALLTFTAVVFRAEVALLLASLVLYALLVELREVREVVQVVKTGVKAGVGSVLLTTILDTYLWRSPYPLWPELHSLYFNVYQNRSSEWGVSPFHAYFTSHLPKLLLTALPLALLGLLVEPRLRGLLGVVGGAFVTGMSALGHKEWRFVVYVVPLFNVAAARGCVWLIRQRTRSALGQLGLPLVYACIALNVLVTAVLTQVSMSNYPGGVALSRFNELFVNETQNVHVHVSNLAAQTGATLFLQVHSPPYPSFLPPPHTSSSSPTRSAATLFKSPFSGGVQTPDWIYNKTENLSPQEITSSRHFTHAIVEVEQVGEFLLPSSSSGYGKEGGGEWEMVECIMGFDGFVVTRGTSNPVGGTGMGEEKGGIWDKIPRLSVRYSEKLCILSRRR